MAIEAVTTPLAKLFPLLVGLLADQFGLGVAIWLLLLGPIALMIGIPRQPQHVSMDIDS
jgi:FSR family fosmidomycin resistance protein-like MFS transporter